MTDTETIMQDLAEIYAPDPDLPRNWWLYTEHLERTFAREERLQLKDELYKVATERKKQNRGPIYHYHQRMREMAREVAELSDVTRPALVELRNKLAGSLRQKQRQWIYIAQYGDVVKVGVSVQPMVRIEAHTKHTGFPPKLLATFRGDESVETAICSSFEKYTVEGREWFSAEPVAGIVRQYQLPMKLIEMLMRDMPEENSWPKYDENDRRIMMGFGLVGRALND